MEKFTKGPWIADIRGGCCAVYAESREGDTAGCHSDDERNIFFSRNCAEYNGNYWVMSDESIANANLIAAAPEMYAEIKADLERMLETQKLIEGKLVDEQLNAGIKRKTALLAKARGEL